MTWRTLGLLLPLLAVLSASCGRSKPHEVALGTAPAQPATGNENAPVAKERRSEFQVDDEAQCVTRRDANDQLLWSTPLDGYIGRNRGPHLLSDADRVYVSHNGGVSALAAANGKVVWHGKGPSDRMLLSGDLLMAAECGVGEYLPDQTRWMVARLAATGAEAFKVKIGRASCRERV